MSKKQTIKNHITKVFEQIQVYGEKKVHKQLLEERLQGEFECRGTLPPRVGFKSCTGR